MKKSKVGFIIISMVGLILLNFFGNQLSGWYYFTFTVLGTFFLLGIIAIMVYRLFLKSQVQGIQGRCEISIEEKR